MENGESGTDNPSFGDRYFQMNVEQSEEEEGLVEQKRNSLASINY